MTANSAPLKLQTNSEARLRSKFLAHIFKLGRCVDDERRFRVGVLGGILLGAAGASLILAGIIPNVAQRAAVAAIAAIALVCALLLRLGKLEPAAMAMSATIALVAYATVFMAPFQHNSEIYIVGFFGIFSLILAGLITGGKAGFIMAVAERNQRLVLAPARRARPSRKGRRRRGRRSGCRDGY